VVHALLPDQFPVDVDVVVHESVEVDGFVQLSQGEQKGVVNLSVVHSVDLTHHSEKVDEFVERFVLFSLSDDFKVVGVVFGFNLIEDGFLDSVVLDLLLSQFAVAFVVFHFLSKFHGPVVVVKVVQKDFNCLLVESGSCFLVQQECLFIEFELTLGLASQSLCVVVIEALDILFALFRIRVETVADQELLQLAIVLLTFVVEDQFLQKVT